MRNSINENKITAAKENYLKTLLALSDDAGVRLNDVANALSVSMASASCMMNHLQEKGYIKKEKYSPVFLTERGREEAIRVRRRYEILKTFFVRVLGVDAATAAQDACQIEHVISAYSVDRIDTHLRCLCAKQ